MLRLRLVASHLGRLAHAPRAFPFSGSPFGHRALSEFWLALQASLFGDGDRSSFGLCFFENGIARSLGFVIRSGFFAVFGWRFLALWMVFDEVDAVDFDWGDFVLELSLLSFFVG